MQQQLLINIINSVIPFMYIYVFWIKVSTGWLIIRGFHFKCLNNQFLLYKLLKYIYFINKLNNILSKLNLTTKVSTPIWIEINKFDFFVNQKLQNIVL